MSTNEKKPISMDEAIVKYMNRSVINLYTDKIEMARNGLNYEQLGILLCLILDHSQLEDTTELESTADEMTRVYFQVIKQAIDYDREIWIRNCINGSQGGRPAKDRLFAKDIEKRIKAIKKNPNETQINPNETQNKAKDITNVTSITNQTDMSISTDKDMTNDMGIYMPKDRVVGEEISAENSNLVPKETIEFMFNEVKRIHAIRRDFDADAVTRQLFFKVKENPNYDIKYALNNLETFGEGY